jgi:hypothetical protein
MPTQSRSHQNKPDPFVDLPGDRRENLKSRLAEFIEDHRTKQWEKVYSMYADQYKQGAVEFPTKDKFLKQQLYSRVHKFTVRALQRMPDRQDAWMIWGCASFDGSGGLEAALETYYERGDWYFGDIVSVVPCVDCPPNECRHK